MPVMKMIKKDMLVKVWTDQIDDNALLQLENMSKLPFIHKHIAVMPDVHWGIGAAIGSVIPSKGAIMPAAVGVDLGIIPGSMVAKSFIVKGKGNKESFCSCSHGAGSVLGRKQAIKKYTVADLRTREIVVNIYKNNELL